MRARVCTLAEVAPRLVSVVKERSSSSVKPTGCAVLGIPAGYGRRARSYNNYCYKALGTVSFASNLNLSCIRPQWWGATANGTTDDTAALNASIVAFNSRGGGEWYLSAGKYRSAACALTTITATGIVRGEGHTDANVPSTSTTYGTQIVCESATATLLTVGSNNLRIEDLDIKNTAASTPTAGAGIHVVNATNAYQATYLKFVAVERFYTDVDFEVNDDGRIEDCRLTNAVHYGLLSRNVLLADTGGLQVTRTSFISSLGAGTAIRRRAARTCCYPGTGADDNAVGTRTWSNPSGITADGGAVASTSLSALSVTHYLKGTNFGFAVPVGATITGVVVEIERGDFDETDQVVDSVVKLIKGGVVSGNNKATATTYSPSAFEVASYGGSSDLWGLTLTPTDVNASNFGVVLSAATTSGAGAPLVDFVRVTAHYTTSSGAASATVMLMGGD
jgi:hypothetical protein